MSQAINVVEEFSKRLTPYVGLEYRFCDVTVSKADVFVINRVKIFSLYLPAAAAVARARGSRNDAVLLIELSPAVPADLQLSELLVVRGQQTDVITASGAERALTHSKAPSRRYWKERRLKDFRPFRGIGCVIKFKPMIHWTSIASSMSDEIVTK